MGDIFSKTKTKTRTMLETVLDEKIVSNCPKDTIEQKQVVGEIVVKNGCKLEIGQRTVLQSKCAIDSITKNLEDYNIKNKADISKGLMPNLFAIKETDTETDINSKIQTFIENNCQNTNATQEQIVEKVYCEGQKSGLQLLQFLDLKTSCVVNTLLENANKWETENEVKVDESLGFGGIVSKWFTMQIVAIIVVAILIIALLIWLGSGDNASNVAKLAVLAA